MLEGDFSDPEIQKLNRMETCNSLLKYWQLIRECRYSDLDGLLNTGGVVLAGSVRNIVAVCKTRACCEVLPCVSTL